MKTPIHDFAKKYSEKNFLRLHMPGHKGKTFLGLEPYDLTEFDGADSLFSANGIIHESELNAGTLFNADTFYSTEGSSLSIRAMLFLCCKLAKSQGKKPTILAGRNAHKAFLSAISLIDLEVEWLYSNDSYISCDITAKQIEEYFSNAKNLPFALYLTSPDYLGNTVDISSISKVCKKYGVLLLVDNAHGAYLKFLPISLHPIDLGADICCDSAHKTLPALTGASYLHINKNASPFFKDNAKEAMSLFASTSPSYLILQSLDLLNSYLDGNYKKKLLDVTKQVEHLKSALVSCGYTLIGNEPLKICIQTKPFGYYGYQFNELLTQSDIMCEFYDKDFIVFMFSSETAKCDLLKLEKTLTDIPKKQSLLDSSPKNIKPQKAMSIREAFLSASETIAVKDADNKVLSSLIVNCPPAIPIVVSGELIDNNVISALTYYGINTCKVVK